MIVYETRIEFVQSSLTVIRRYISRNDYDCYFLHTIFRNVVLKAYRNYLDGKVDRFGSYSRNYLSSKVDRFGNYSYGFCPVQITTNFYDKEFVNHVTNKEKDIFDDNYYKPYENINKFIYTIHDIQDY